jgi:hypothetical protein
MRLTLARVVATCAAASAAVAIVWYLVSHTDVDRRVTVPSIEKVARDSRLQLQADESPLDVTRGQEPTLAANRAAQGVPQPPPLPATQTAPMLGRDNLLTLKFLGEGRDASWSAATESQILTELSQLVGLSLISIEVECRTTLCRVQPTFPTTNPHGPPRILGIAKKLGLEPHPITAVADKGGSVVFLAYFATPSASSISLIRR